MGKKCYGIMRVMRNSDCAYCYNQEKYIGECVRNLLARKIVTPK